MTIEMHTPQDRIPAGVINQIRNNVLELYHLDPNISRAEVFFHESSTFTGNEPRCNILLTIYKDNIFVSRSGENYTQASQEVLKELKRFIKSRHEAKASLPEELTSTVSV
jgi:hypothetical protein